MRLLVYLFFLLPAIHSLAQCPVGLKVDLIGYHDTPVLIEQNQINLPAKASLKAYCPRPSTQLDHLTSAGWSTSYYAMTILRAQEMGLKDVHQISMESISPTYTQWVNQSANINCFQPISILESLDALVKTGAPKFIDYPYFCPENVSEAPLHQLSGYRRIFNSYDQSATKIMKLKAALSQGLPVVISLKTSSSFCQPERLWSPAPPTGNDFNHHAICIIGYDDLLYDGSFELVNSWGNDWGFNGFINVPYNNLIDRISEAYILYLLPKEQSFSIQVDVRTNTGGTMPVKASVPGKYHFTKAYSSGHQFQIHLTTTFKGFLYLYYENNRGENALLFPSKNEMHLGVLPFNSNAISLPDNEHYIVLDRNSGIEKMAIVLSQRQLSIDDIKTAFNKEKVSNIKFEKDRIKGVGTLTHLDESEIINMILSHI